MMMTLRVAAYGFALAVMIITVALTVAAGGKGLAVAVLGGTLAVTPYVVVRAFEEFRSESVHRLRTDLHTSEPI